MIYYIYDQKKRKFLKEVEGVIEVKPPCSTTKPVDYSKLQENVTAFFNLTKKEWEYKFDAPTMTPISTFKLNKSFISNFISNQFVDIILSLGYLSPSTNKKFDCKQENIVDLQMVLSNMQLNNITIQSIRLYDNTFVDLTYQQLQIVINELIEYKLKISNDKWLFEEKLKTINYNDDMTIIVNELITYNITFSKFINNTRTY